MSKPKPLQDALYEAFLLLENKEECQAFLEDLCTIKEVESMAHRLQAARLLIQGKTYEQIIGESDISSATLSRVSRCVRYGAGGYTSVVKKIENHEK